MTVPVRILIEVFAELRLFLVGSRRKYKMKNFFLTLKGITDPYFDPYCFLCFHFTGTDIPLYYVKDTPYGDLSANVGTDICEK